MHYIFMFLCLNEHSSAAIPLKNQLTFLVLLPRLVVRLDSTLLIQNWETTPLKRSNSIQKIKTT